MPTSVLNTLILSSPIHLYRHLIRRVRILPQGVQEYYKHAIRQGYNSHEDETEPERIQQIIARAVEDAEWVIKKYSQPAAEMVKTTDSLKRL